MLFLNMTSLGVELVTVSEVDRSRANVKAKSLDAD